MASIALEYPDATMAGSEEPAYIGPEFGSSFPLRRTDRIIQTRPLPIPRFPG